MRDVGGDWMGNWGVPTHIMEMGYWPIAAFTAVMAVAAASAGDC